MTLEDLRAEFEVDLVMRMDRDGCPLTHKKLWTRLHGRYVVPGIQDEWSGYQLRAAREEATKLCERCAQALHQIQLLRILIQRTCKDECQRWLDKYGTHTPECLVREMDHGR